MALQSFPYRRFFYPLGFSVLIESNSLEILEAATESWPQRLTYDESKSPLKIRLGVTASSASECPAAPSVRASDNLLSVIADADNFAICDLQQGQAFGWMTEAAVRHRAYLRYHFLEAVALCLLAGTQVTPIHAACVSRDGVGILLCGESGAGKSTLAYACARTGFTFTSDDASYLLWQRTMPTVRGNSYQVRFRPSARALFPELEGRALTPRAEGKPSIEVLTSELPILNVAPESPVHAIVFLSRHASPATTMRRLSGEEITPYLESSLFPLESIRNRQVVALRQLISTDAYQMSYRDLEPAIAYLELLTQGLRGD